MITVKALDIKEYPIWDGMVEKSPQGTIFSTTKWMSLYKSDFWLYACYNGDELCGGIPFYNDKKEEGCYSGINLPITPFQGILTLTNGMKAVKQQSLNTEITETLIKGLDEFKCIEISNHYNFLDARPFIWNGYSTSLGYTYVVDISDISATWDNMEKDTRNYIGKAVKDGITIRESNDVAVFDRLYAATFSRKNLPRTAPKKMIEDLLKTIPSKLYLAYHNNKAVAGVVMMWDSKRAYYILGATAEGSDGASYLALWEAMQDMARIKPELDMVGCNNVRIGHYKKGFGGELKQYVKVRKTSL